MYLFFDIDDTFLDTYSAEHSAALDFANRFPAILDSDAEAFNTTWHAISTYYYDKWTSGKLSFREQRRCRIRHFFGSQLSDMEADDLFSLYLDIKSEHWSAFPDVLPALAQLKEHPMAILTNGDPEQQRAKLIALRINERFPLLVTPMMPEYSSPMSASFTTPPARQVFCLRIVFMSATSSIPTPVLPGTPAGAGFGSIVQPATIWLKMCPSSIRCVNYLLC